jgi:hypothetical protein
MTTALYAINIKEIKDDMPDFINSFKDFEDYINNARKLIKNKFNEEKKANKALSKKRVKKVDVEKDNNIVKVKKPLNKYQMFIRDNREKVKEENPKISGKELFKLIADLWNKNKDDMKRIEILFKNIDNNDGIN